VAGAEEMGRAEGGADKVGVGVGDLEAHSNKKSMAGGEEHRTGGAHGGPATNGFCPPMTCIAKKNAALLNQYLNHFNGLLVLPELLKAGSVCYEDIPILNQFRNPNTGKFTVCWAHVLGPCHYWDCYFATRGSHLGCDDYMDDFADNVVAMLGQAVATRMAADLQGSPEKRQNTESESNA
jgi:hypothetical protein